MRYEFLNFKKISVLLGVSTYILFVFLPFFVEATITDRGLLFGCETGTTHEFGVVGSPECSSSVVRTGDYSLVIDQSSGNESAAIVMHGSTGGGSRIATGMDWSTTGNLIGFAFQTSTLEGTGVSSLVEILTGTNDSEVRIGIDLDSDVFVVVDTDGNTACTGSTGISVDTWYYLELWWERSDTGEAELFVDGSSECTVASDDFDDGVTGSEFVVFVRPASGGSAYFDDLYHIEATASSDRYSVDSSQLPEVFDYASGVTSSTDNGDTLDSGQWSNTGESPWVPANDAEYTSSSASGSTDTDSGSRAGPAGDSNIDGDLNIKQGFWVFGTVRDGGGGTTHSLIYGESSGNTQTTSVSVDNQGTFFGQKEDGSADVPTSSEYCRLGMSVSGAQDFHILDAFCYILHVPDAVASFPTVSTSAASNVTVSSATLNGNITATGGSNATARGFAYGTVSDLSTTIATTSESGSFGTGVFSEVISTLQSGITYYFRAYATNPNGTGYGSIRNFTAGTNTTPTRSMRLFEGYTIKVINSRVILYGQ